MAQVLYREAISIANRISFAIWWDIICLGFGKVILEVLNLKMWDKWRAKMRLGRSLSASMCA